VPVIGGPERRLASADSDCCFSNVSWTPDAKWLVFSSRESTDDPYGIRALSVETGELRRISAPGNTGSSRRALSITGR